MTYLLVKIETTLYEALFLLLGDSLVNSCLYVFLLFFRYYETKRLNVSQGSRLYGPC